MRRPKALRHPDRSRMLLFMIRPARPMLAEAPLAGLSLPSKRIGEVATSESRERWPGLLIKSGSSPKATLNVRNVVASQ
jgi:hypothetical protein